MSQVKLTVETTTAILQAQRFNEALAILGGAFSRAHLACIAFSAASGAAADACETEIERTYRLRTGRRPPGSTRTKRLRKKRSKFLWRYVEEEVERDRARRQELEHQYESLLFSDAELQTVLGRFAVVN